MPPHIPHRRRARQQDRSRPARLPPHQPRRRRIRPVQRQNRIRKHTVVLPRRNRPERPAAIRILTAPVPPRPHRNRPARRPIQTTTTHHTDVLRRPVEHQRLTRRPIPVRPRRRHPDRRPVRPPHRRRIPVERPVRHHRRRIQSRPRPVIKPRLLPRRPAIRPTRVIPPQRIDRHQRPDRRARVRKIPRPRRPAQHHARRPMLRLATRRPRLALRQRRPRSIRSHRPRPAIPIIHPVHQSPVPIPQLHPLPGIRKAPRQRPQHPRQPSRHLQPRRIRRHHQIPAPSNHRPLRKHITHPSLNPPCRQIDINRHLIVQLNPFPARITRHRMILQFVEHNHTVDRRRHHRQQHGQRRAKG